MKTQGQLRKAFFARHRIIPRMVSAGRSKTGRLLYRRATQNEYPADIRMAWVDFVDACHKSGEISDELANFATL